MKVTCKTKPGGDASVVAYGLTSDAPLITHEKGQSL